MSSTMTKKKSEDRAYFLLRMQQIGFNPETDVAPFETMPGESNSKVQHELFWDDDDGNICIGIMGLDGMLLGYNEKDHTKHMQAWRPIHWKRLQKPYKGTKYLPCRKGLGVFPYIPKPLVDKYQKGTKINKLIITEGYIKAFVGSKIGLNIIGLPGITVWKQKRKGKVFREIENIVKKCNVQNIMFVTDADTLDVQWEEGKDLAKRPFSFFTAVRLFKEMCVDFNVELYFTHIVTGCPDKGLDDLVISNRDQTDAIKKEIQNINPSPKYFAKKMNMISSGTSKLLEYFHITSAAQFHNKYEDEIGFKKFIFRGHEYQKDDDTGEIIQRKVADAARFIQIGAQIYQKGGKPTKQGTIENVLVPIKKEQLQKIFAKKKNPKHYAKLVHEQMEYYDGAINIPDHGDTYEERSVTENEEGFMMNWKNLYHQVAWHPRKGNCDTSISFVKHIFGENDITHEGKVFKEYELGLDYIKLLWQFPKLKLPIVCLVSEARHTGKTTFWDWMRLFFQQNVRFVRVDQLTGQFTAYWASKLIAVIDEAIVDKQNTVERIKSLATAETFELRGLFANGEEINSYLKIGVSSNKIHDFMKIDDDETRFWIRDIPTVPKANRIHNLLEILTKEIPSFIYFLENREFVTKQSSRSWFSEDLIVTDALKRLKSEGKWDVEKMIIDTLKDQFGNIKKPVLHFNLSELHFLVDDVKMNKGAISACLRKKMKKKVSSPRNYKYWQFSYGSGISSDDFTVSHTVRHGRVYTFHAHEYYEGLVLFDVCKWSGLLYLEKKGFDIRFETYKRYWIEKHMPIKDICDYISSDDTEDTFKGLMEQKSIENISLVIKKIAEPIYENLFKTKRETASPF